MAGAAVEVDEYSVATTPIELRFNETKLATATAFFWEEGGQLYLVSNWHNFTGKDSRTGTHLSKVAAEPNFVSFDIFFGENIGRRSRLSVRLLDEHNDPLWLEHPEFGRRVDVACLPVSLAMGRVYPLNAMSEAPLRGPLGENVFILGYPMNLRVQGFPIWKRGSIASEPNIDAEDLPLIYVDSASSKGMSGAPVVLRSTSGGAYFEDGGYVVTSRTLTRFLGVYSGRLAPADQFEASIGPVWKARVVREIIAGSQKGKR